MSAKADRVVVLKTERKLILMQGDYVLSVYRIALGRYPTGHKQQEGDSKTPEGSYTLDYKLKDSDFYRAIRVSYPNDQDISYARERGVDPGGKIMIHGLPNKLSATRVGHPSIDWTQGCIAVTNREMDEIWGMVDPGTPIEIHP
jgi:murein L,D-transpeptidase YafK